MMRNVLNFSFFSRFDSNVLQCSTCDSLLKIVGDQSIFDDCANCCRPDEKTQRFRSAVLQVDKRFLMAFPDIKSVIKSSKELKIGVEYSFGSRPMLLMYKNDGDEDPAESIPVHSWSKDTFQEYLASSLFRDETVGSI